MPEPTMADIAVAFERVFGYPLAGGERPRVHPLQELADERRIERAQDERAWAAYATGREMDGAAADHVYGREPAGDWRMP